MAAFSDVEHPWSWLHREEIKCSSCPAQVNPFNVWYRHPVLKTIQCSECYKFYNQGRPENSPKNPQPLNRYRYKSKKFAEDITLNLPKLKPNITPT